jgi:hypothetical protein
MAIGILFSVMPAQADFRSAAAKAGEKVFDGVVHGAKHAATHGLIHGVKHWWAEEPAERERGRVTPFP